MQWSQQQATALKKVADWIKDKRAPQVFRLFGFAGTGKTTLAKELAGTVQGQVQFGAFTGKASLVLRQKGCHNASTIHSMIYRLVEDTDGKPTFILNRDSDIAMCQLIIIDECSMVDEELGRDLLSFGVKVLVLGDPAQLPPVKGAGFFTSQEPDVLLTDIHRQAADNPIIRLSMDARDGKRLQIGTYGTSKIIRRNDLDRTEVMNADQVIVGLNRTRRTYNARIRKLKGISSGNPVPGDRLVCLRNNREKGLLNGGMWEVNSSSSIAGKFLSMRVRSLDDPGVIEPVEASVPIEFFEGREEQVPWKVRREHDEFDFGYVITAHKSQGSQWDKVVLFDESGCFRDDSWRWIYTGITRASESLIIVVP